MAHSIVKSVQSNGTFDSQHGLLYKFVYEFEDGVGLAANHKTVTGFFAVGKQVQYEIKGSNNYGNYGSIKTPELDNVGGMGNTKELKAPGLRTQRDPTQLMIARQSSLKIALEQLIFVANQGIQDKAVTIENVMAVSEKYVNYVFEGL